MLVVDKVWKLRRSDKLCRLMELRGKESLPVCIVRADLSLHLMQDSSFSRPFLTYPNTDPTRRPSRSSSTVSAETVRSPVSQRTATLFSLLNALSAPPVARVSCEHYFSTQGSSECRNMPCSRLSAQREQLHAMQWLIYDGCATSLSRSLRIRTKTCTALSSAVDAALSVPADPAADDPRGKNRLWPCDRDDVDAG